MTFQQRTISLFIPPRQKIFPFLTEAHILRNTAEILRWKCIWVLCWRELSSDELLMRQLYFNFANLRFGRNEARGCSPVLSFFFWQRICLLSRLALQGIISPNPKGHYYWLLLVVLEALNMTHFPSDFNNVLILQAIKNGALSLLSWHSF